MGGRVGWWMLGTMLLASLVPGTASGGVRRAEPLPWPRPEVLRLALDAWDGARAERLVGGSVLTVIDYTLPSTSRRLWVIDLATRRVLFHELVAHGAGSGANFAAAFSNRPGSRQSSLGLFRTGEVYRGEHGPSLRLAGLEPGINDRAMERAIVMHGAPYVSRAVVAAQGQLGRSWGCPALERGVERRVIERIKGGTALFAYYPEPRWLAGSRFLRPPQRSSAIARSSHQYPASDPIP